MVLVAMQAIWGVLDRHGHAGLLLVGPKYVTLNTYANRSFEFLGACPSGNTTLKPGPESFTTALIWSLQNLAEKQTRFLVSELSEKIREAPGFPEDQVPVTVGRDPGSIERIMLAPLPRTSVRKEDTPLEPGSQGLLNLNFIFDEPPRRDVIRQFGESLNRFMWTSKMPVSRVVWGGLTCWGGSHPSPGAHVQKLAAAKRFKEGLKRKSERKRRESEGAKVARLQTPLSSVEGATLSPSPRSDLSQPATKKRKTSSN